MRDGDALRGCKEPRHQKQEAGEELSRKLQTPATQENPRALTAEGVTAEALGRDTGHQAPSPRHLETLA